MHVMIIGAAGMIGRKLTGVLAEQGAINGQTIERLTGVDIVEPGIEVEQRYGRGDHQPSHQ